MSEQHDMPDGSPGSSRPSVDPNMYVLSEAIRSSMENSMAFLSATMQQNALVMANTIREGFAARPSLEGDPHTLTKKRARTSSQVARDDSSGSSHKKSWSMVREARTAQVVLASPRQSEGEEDEEVSLLDPTDAFSDPAQAEAAVTTVSTLDRATARF